MTTRAPWPTLPPAGTDLVIVGQSYGAFTATLAASQLPARLLVLLAGMIPAPGESPGEWWANTGYQQAAEEQARLDGGKTGHDDPLISFYNGVPRPLAEEALRRGGRGESSVGLGHALATRCVAGRAHQVHPRARTTSSSPPPSCGGWHKNAWAPSRTRFPAVTAPRSATPGN